MTREQALALCDRLNSDPQMRELLDRPDPTCPPDATLAGIGVPYRLSDRDVPAPSLAAVAILSMIRSPLLDDAGETVDLLDCWRALWAVTATASDLSCLHGLDSRCDAIRRGCARAELPPETCVRLQAEATAAAYAEVDKRALEVASRYPGATAQDVADLVSRMLVDISNAWARVPRRSEDGDENPQMPASASTATGWPMWRTVRRWLAALLPRAIFGLLRRRGLACR